MKPEISTAGTFYLMLDMLVKSFSQLYDPRTRGVLWKCASLALILYFSIVTLAWWGIKSLTGTGWETLDSIIAAAGGLIAILMGGMFYPALVTILIGLFSETLCRQVEALHYPLLGPGRSQPISEILIGTIVFALKTIAFNILALMLTIAIPGLNVFVFLAVNGYLISVEYFEMAAIRRMDLKQTNTLRKRHQGRLWLAGSLFTIGMTVPLLGIIAPIVAMVFMVHQLESMRPSPTGTEIVPGSKTTR